MVDHRINATIFQCNNCDKQLLHPKHLTRYDLLPSPLSPLPSPVSRLPSLTMPYPLLIILFVVCRLTAAWNASITICVKIALQVSLTSILCTRTMVASLSVLLYLYLNIIVVLSIFLYLFSINYIFRSSHSEVHWNYRARLSLVRMYT